MVRVLFTVRVSSTAIYSLYVVISCKSVLIDYDNIMTNLHTLIPNFKTHFTFRIFVYCQLPYHALKKNKSIHFKSNTNLAVLVKFLEYSFGRIMVGAMLPNVAVTVIRCKRTSYCIDYSFPRRP